MNKKLLGLGYPIGFAPINGSDFFNIQLNDRMYPLNLIGSYIWINALNITSREVAINESIKELKIHGYELDKDYSYSEIEDIYSILLTNNLIIEFDEKSMVSDLSILNKSQFLRKGFGLGLENNKIYVIKDKEKQCLSSIEYLIWQLSDGKKTYQEIFKYVVKNIGMLEDNTVYEKEELDSLIVQNILSLYKKDLINIISI